MASLIPIPEVKEGPECTESESCPETAFSTESEVPQDPAEEISKIPELTEKHSEETYTYTKPIEDPLQKSYRYLSKHDILSLFQVSSHRTR